MSDITRSSLRALAFDIYGTVVDWRSVVLRELTAHAARKGLRFDAESMAQAWRQERATAISAVRRGSRPWASMTELLAETVGVLLEALTGSTPEELALRSHYKQSPKAIPCSLSPGGRG